MVEKEEKRRLEARITSMQSQLLIGGHKIEDMPVFRYAAVTCQCVILIVTIMLSGS